MFTCSLVLKKKNPEKIRETFFIFKQHSSAELFSF